MAFVVNEVQPISLRLNTIRSFSWPSEGSKPGDLEVESEDRAAVLSASPIRSTLVLGERSSRRSRGGTWWSGVGEALGWQAGEGVKQNYHILLAQSREDDPQSGVETSLSCFELYQGSEATSVFENLCALLGPLLDRGVLLVTAKLLSALVLPTLKEPADLPAVLLNEDIVEIKDHLSSKFDGKSLLQLACEKGDSASTRALLDHGADALSVDEKDGNTALHAAAKRSLECLKHILSHIEKFLTHLSKQNFFNQQNRHGYTALQLACQHNKPDAVEALVRAGAILSIASPAVIPSTGSSGCGSLHIAAAQDNHECISAIGRRHTYLSTPQAEDNGMKEKEKQDALNATDSNGDTPLLIAVRKGHVDSALALVIEGADPNCPNATTSDHPLTVAAHHANINLVRLLLAFGANPSSTNASGKTPIDEAKGASKPETQKQECIDAIKAFIVGQAEEASTATPSSTENNPTTDDGSVFLLSLDGGGIRGLVISQLLLVLEERMKKLHPNPPHISTFFDWITGTSTGAYVALGVALYKSPPVLCRKMYFEFKKKALAGHRVYPAKGIDHSLRDAFGETAVMANIKAPRVCVFTCLADRLPPELHLMCNYGEARDGQLDPSKRHVWAAARASSAAPTYFPAFDKTFIDGGVMANNPTLDSLTEIFSMAEKEKRVVKIGCILSLGTGVVPTTRISGIDIIEPYTPTQIYDDVQAMKELVDLFICQSTISNGQETTRARAWSECMRTPYFRFSPPIDNIELNETDNEKLIKMLFDTMVYTFERQEEIDQLAKLLLARIP